MPKIKSSLDLSFAPEASGQPRTLWLYGGAAGDQMAQLAGAGFSARVTNHADVSPTSTMCQNALMGSVSTG